MVNRKEYAQVLLEKNRQIWAEVKANHVLLDGCPRHDFSEVADTHAHGLPRTYRCSNCRGTLASIEVHWYNLGLKHGESA